MKVSIIESIIAGVTKINVYTVILIIINTLIKKSPNTYLALFKNVRISDIIVSWIGLNSSKTNFSTILKKSHKFIINFNISGVLCNINITITIKCGYFLFEYIIHPIFCIQRFRFFFIFNKKSFIVVIEIKYFISINFFYY